MRELLRVFLTGLKHGPSLVHQAQRALSVALEPCWPDRETANVVGVLPGSDPSLAEQVVVVGAHHDHLGRGAYGSLGGPSAVGAVHPGADDNASGCGCLPY